MGYLTVTLFLQINFLTSFLNPQRVWQHLFIPATILTTVVVFSCGYLLYLPLKRLFNSGKTSQLRLRNKMLTCSLLILIISGVFLSINPVIQDQQLGFTDAKSLFGKFQTIKENDLQMMYWIKENIGSSQVILVSWGDSGQFLSAICQRQAVSLYSRLENYSDLMELLTANASDLRAIPLMVKYNISYVYIGSTATTYALQMPYYRHFNATQFLSSPYFSLSKQVDNTWLFKFESSVVSSVNYDVGK